MRVLITALVGISILSAGAAGAQEETDPTRYEQGVGFAAGFYSGAGLSYIFHFDGPWSVQTAGGIWKTGSSFDYDIGVLIRRTLQETRNTRLYACTGLALFEERDTYDEFIPESGRTREVTSVNTNWNTGLGLGIQFFLSNRIGVSLDGGFAFFLNDDKILFLPQGAIQYHF